MGYFDWLTLRMASGRGAITRLLIIMVATFLVGVFLRLVSFLWQADANALLTVFYTPADLSLFFVRPWTIFTYMFFHAGFWHIIGNLLWLYFIGNILNDFLPDRRIYQVFLGGGILGALFYLVSFNVFPVFNAQIAGAKLLGASGGVLAVVVATAALVPHYTLRPFNLFNIEMRWIALISVLLDLIAIPNGNAGGHIAHLGGALFGLLYIRSIQGAWRMPHFRLPAWFPFQGKPDERKIRERKMRQAKSTNASGKPRQEEVDAILDKISQSGYSSLSTEEKELLFRASE